jgi:hypothetical protein
MLIHGFSGYKIDMNWFKNKQRIDRYKKLIVQV